MKAAWSVLVILSFLCTVAVMGCVPGLRSAKPGSPSERVADTKAAPPRAGSEKTADPSKKELDRLLAAPPPPDKVAASAGDRRLLIKPSDLGSLDEVRQAALTFAQGLKNVKHVKTCYSKASGGWFLALYVPGVKNTIEQEYSWNKDTKEWELSGTRRALPTKDLDIYLKSELPDEKCFLLK